MTFSKTYSVLTASFSGEEPKVGGSVTVEAVNGSTKEQAEDLFLSVSLALDSKGIIREIQPPATHEWKINEEETERYSR